MASQTTENMNTPAGRKDLSEGELHIQPRHGHVDGEGAAEISGYDHGRMKDRTLLTYEEEKKLLRRVDWHLMLLCSIIFMVKNVDANNVSPLGFWPIHSWQRVNGRQAAHARIMNRGTPRNILTELNMTGDDYNWVSTIYYVRCPPRWCDCVRLTQQPDTVHCFRDTVQSDHEENAAFEVPGQDHGIYPATDCQR